MKGAQMKIDREIRTLICDLDGTLMNPGGGPME